MIAYNLFDHSRTRRGNESPSLRCRHRNGDDSNNGCCNVDDPRQNHYRAQRLNNQAACYIDLGQYDQAIVLLVEALRQNSSKPISGSRSSILQMDGCSCSHCSLDECIAYSERRAQRAAAQGMVHGHRSTNSTSIAKKRKIVAGLRLEEQNEDTEDERKGNFLHRRPILVTPTTIAEGHIMGRTLSLIATFNLALANHLKVVAYIGEQGRYCNSATNGRTKTAPLPEGTRECFRQILRLYELAYKWKVDLCLEQHNNNSFRLVNGNSRQNSTTTNSGDMMDNETHQDPQYCEENYAGQQQQQQQQQPRSSLSSFATTFATGTESASTLPSLQCNNDKDRDGSNSSLRFDMIMCNNLSQIHRMTHNHSKERKCLEHLTAILMAVIDWQRDALLEEEDVYNSENEGQQTLPRDSLWYEIDAESLLLGPNGANNEDLFSSSERQQHQPPPEVLSGIVRKRKGRSRYMDVDGFLYNITPLILTKECAHAA